MLSAFAAEIPKLNPSAHHTEANTFVYASDGHTKLAILRGAQSRIIVRSDQISPWMKDAIVAIEDKRFYEHHGVDLRGMLRALVADITHHGAVQGGSTITQQFVKNAFLTTQKTFARKLVEAALAWQLERKWTKDQILTAYLNTVYFGNGAYGVEQASRIYFHHSAATLNIAEAALLAGIPEDPSLWDPVAHPQAAKARRDLVLQQMLAEGWITQSQYDKWHPYPMPNPQNVSLPATQNTVAPYFANYVKDQLIQHYGPARTLGGGLKVTTTLNVGLQRLARLAVSSVLPPSPDNPAAALVAIDAKTGAVLAMVGGSNYHTNQFNLATQGERQPGSSFKPFVLATALADGIAPSSIFDSHPVTINADGKLWKVNNYEGEYLGPIDLTHAIAYSDNSVFSQLTALVGPRNVAHMAHALGITSPLQGYFAIGLGAEPATPLEMARAYASFADGGSRIDGALFGNQPRAIATVTDSSGHTQANVPVYRHVLTTDQAELINQLLQGVVQYGTGKAAAIPGWEVAGKTGTTENYGDAWFVGYTPQLVTAVWVGYPNKLIPMTTQFHGGPVAGGTYPALIWHAFMTRALKFLGDQPEAFPQPNIPYAAPVTVVNRGGALERDDGVCHNTYSIEAFGGEVLDAGRAARVATCKPNEVDIPDVVGEPLEAARVRVRDQPLTPLVVYKPAQAGQRAGIVVAQAPSQGTLSAYDRLTLVVTKALNGVVPRVVGLPVQRAKSKLARLKLDVRVVGGGPKVSAQSPPPGTAVGPGVRVTLTAAAG
jgi:penicillin-binding protein 1A